MKTKEEIQVMIEKCKELRRYIPQNSIFGTDNWKNLDVQIVTLTVCLDSAEFEIEDRISYRVDIVGDEWCSDPEVQVYDWLIHDTPDLVEDDDIECLKKKAQESDEGST